MTTTVIPIWLYYTFIVVIFLLLGLIAYFFLFLWNNDNTDKILFFDKNMRWNLISKSLKGKDKHSDKNKDYHLTENMGFLNAKGKTLYIFNENDAQPMKIEKHVGKWLDPASLKGVINNKLVQLMLKPADNLKDTLELMGAIGGIIAGIGVSIQLLITLGVI